MITLVTAGSRCIGNRGVIFVFASKKYLACLYEMLASKQRPQYTSHFLRAPFRTNRPFRYRGKTFDFFELKTETTTVATAALAPCVTENSSFFAHVLLFVSHPVPQANVAHLVKEIKQNTWLGSWWAGNLFSALWFNIAGLANYHNKRKKNIESWSAFYSMISSSTSYVIEGDPLGYYQ